MGPLHLAPDHRPARGHGSRHLRRRRLARPARTRHPHCRHRRARLRYHRRILDLCVRQSRNADVLHDRYDELHPFDWRGSVLEGRVEFPGECV